MYAIRNPRAAGVFYNSDRAELQREIETSFRSVDDPKDTEVPDVVAMITPHDKYHLCGPVFAWAFSKARKVNYVILGANHLDAGSRFAIMKEGLWKTPLGEVAVSNRVAQKIIDRSRMVDYDVMPHENEHSIEVQLPFLQYRFGNDFKIVPLTIRNRFEDGDFVEDCKALGKAIAHSILTEKEKWSIIATTDFSHGPERSVKKVDRLLIDSMKNLSEKKLFETVHKKASYICGYGAVLTALSAAKEMKARRSKLLKYMTSGNVVQNAGPVLGYASIIIY